MTSASAPKAMTRREWCSLLLRRLHEVVAREAPAGLGYWSAAWRLVEQPSNELLDTLADFRRTGAAEDKRACIEAATAVIYAWREAAAEWERAGRPQTPELVPDHEVTAA